MIKFTFDIPYISDKDKNPYIVTMETKGSTLPFIGSRLYLAELSTHRYFLLVETVTFYLDDTPNIEGRIISVNLKTKQTELVDYIDSYTMELIVGELETFGLSANL